MRFIFLVFSFLIFSNSKSQNSLDRLQSKGDMPDDFKRLYSHKYEKSLEDQKVEKLKNKKSRETFSALTTYSIDNLLKSGRVIYGDPITTYCQRVIDLLLKNSTGISEKFRIYTLKSNDVNAYSTHQGIIIITTGLISRLETEAELAYILAHEIAHVTESHSIESFTYNSALFKKDVSGRSNDFEEKLLKSSQHSKESELEADTEGWNLYIGAGYTPNAISKVFDKLLYSYLPAKQVMFPYSEYGSKFYSLNPKDKEVELNDIEAEEDVDDSKSTHPNTKKRKKNIEKKNQGLDNVSTLSSQIKDIDFSTIRNLAYKQSIYEFVIKNRYTEALILIDAIDSSLSISEEFKDKFKAMCLYGIQSLANSDQEEMFTENIIASEVQGVQLSYYQLLDNLNQKEINVLAVRNIFKLSRKNPSNKILARILDQSIEEMALNSNISTTYFDEPPADDHLKKANKKCYTCYNAFKGAKASEIFLKQYKTISLRVEENENEETILSDDNKENTVSKLVIFSPKYVGMDMRYSINKRFLKNEKNSEFILNQIKDYADRLDIELDVVDSWQEETAMNTEALNEYAILRDWLTERSGFSSTLFRGIIHEDVGKLRKKFGTDNLGLSIYWNLIERKKFNPKLLALGLVTFYGFPVYLKWQLSPYSYGGYTFALINMDNGKVGFFDAKLFDTKFRKHLINAHLYHSLNQLK